MRTIIFLLSLGVAVLQYKLWLGDGSVRQRQALEVKISRLQGENSLIVAHNRSMEADIIELKQGDQALEEQARYELGMVKQGEQYYQFLE